MKKENLQYIGLALLFGPVIIDIALISLGVIHVTCTSPLDISASCLQPQILPSIIAIIGAAIYIKFR